jgi:hypothetical protein
MMRIGICCVALAFAVPSWAAEATAFRLSKEVDRSAAPKESILAVTVDSDVYAATRPGFPDLRIFNAQDKEVPYVVEKATESRMHTVRRPCASKVAALDEHGDDLDVVIRLDRDAPAADGLSIFTPLTNYERRVDVYGSDNGIDWTPLVSGRLVFDYSRYMDVSNREVALPKNAYRQLKVSIAGIADAKESPFLDLTRKYRGGSETERTERTVLERRPFRMNRIELWHDATEKLSETEKSVDYRVANWRAEEDAKAKTTIVQVSTRREPVNELTLATSSRNFNRSAVLEIPVKRGDRTEWIDIGRGTLSLVDFGGYHKESLRISFPEHRETEYRIVIDNKDNPPLKITGITARGNVYQAIFLAAENETYRLCYGSEEVESPTYDAAVVLASVRGREAASEGRLGEQVASAAVRTSSGSTMRSLLNSPYLFGAAIIVLVAVLGWALFRAARRINELPKE